MELFQILLFLCLLISTIDGFTRFHHQPSIRIRRESTDSNECCVSSKLNVGTKKANHGRDFFRNLTTKINSYKMITPENMCSLMHFLIQQAKLNNKSVTFRKGLKDDLLSTVLFYDKI